MQQAFDYEAPKYYNFLHYNPQRSSSDFSINLSDPNDYWFMITHVEVSPSKQDHEEQDQESKESAPKPIVRTSIKPNQERVVTNHVSFQETNIQEKSNDQLVVKVEKIVPLKKTTRKTEAVQAKPISKREKSKKQRQTTNLLVKRQARSKTERQNAQIPRQINSKRSNKSLDIKPKRQNPFGGRPCPFAPRIQRQWQKRTNKNWYNLSPTSMDAAQKSMAKIKKEKSLSKIQIKQQKPRFRY